MFNFSNKVTDKKLFKTLGKSSFIRNGIGYGFISEDYLYDNGFIEIGIGRVTSGSGDWGGGFSHSTTSPLKITINKDFIIQKVETDSFYNSDSSQKTEKIAKKYIKKLKVGDVFIVKDEEFKRHIQGILDFIPCKNHIGHDVFSSPHMLKHFTKPEDKYHYYKLKDPENAGWDKRRSKLADKIDTELNKSYKSEDYDYDKSNELYNIVNYLRRHSYDKENLDKYKLLKQAVNDLESLYKEYEIV